jgi:TetR/AcrR family transcriptional regulator
VTKETARRGKGRPAAKGAEVGKEGLIRATRALLREVPPSQVTRQMVGDRAGADPALVRYYFGTVENLVAEVAQATNAEAQSRAFAVEDADPIDALHARIVAAYAMFAENPHHHEIMMRYQLGSRNAEIKERWRAGLARTLTQLRATLARGAASGELRAVDERYLHVILMGTLQFFPTSEPLLRDMFGVSVSVEDLQQEFLAFFEDILLNGLRPRDKHPTV